MTSERAGAARVAPGRATRIATAMAVAALAAGCASAPDSGTREYLDEHSAATVTVVQPGITFARDRTDLAVHARDYFTMVPVDVNRMGNHEQYFYCMAWSTIDKRAAPDAATGQRRFQLVADGRSIPLAPTSKTLREVGVVEQPVEHLAQATDVLLVPTDRDTIHYVAGASSLRVVLDDAGTTFRYELWSGDPRTLATLP